jgi:hypothetical protein
MSVHDKLKPSFQVNTSLYRRQAFLMHLIFVAALSNVILSTFIREIWITTDDAFELQSLNLSLIVLSNSQKSIVLNQSTVVFPNRVIVLKYDPKVHELILNSTSEDNYQLNLELQGGAFVFNTEVQGFSGLRRVQYVGTFVTSLCQFCIETHLDDQIESSMTLAHAMKTYITGAAYGVISTVCRLIIQEFKVY